MISLEEQAAVLHLSDEGRKVLKQAGVDVPDVQGTLFDIQEMSDHGVWVRFNYPDGRHVFLIRWSYISAIDVTVGEIRTEDLVN